MMPIINPVPLSSHVSKALKRSQAWKAYFSLWLNKILCNMTVFSTDNSIVRQTKLERRGIGNRRNRAVAGEAERGWPMTERAKMAVNRLSK